MHVETLKDGYLLTTESYLSEASVDWFSPDYWHAANAIVNSKEGRTTAWFYAYGDSVYVLKHFRRGGLVGRILNDQYLYTGLKNTRVYREFMLLNELLKQGLPAPKPKAAQVRISGLIYRGDLITEAIKGARSVCEICQARSLRDQELVAIAKTLSAFHNAGVYHADLNANNILLDDQGDAYLIDFDRGEFRVPEASWQQENINRLKRSFNKESQRWPEFHFEDETWTMLSTTYQEALE